MLVEAALNFQGLFKLPILFIWVLKERCDHFPLPFSKKPEGYEYLSATVISTSETLKGETLLSSCFSFPFSSLALSSEKQTAPSGGSTLANARCLFHFFRQVVAVSWQEKK